MKRFHIHVAVADLDQSIGFYSKLFGSAPSLAKADYAKWMLDDPRINFAISARGAQQGINHLGFQVDSDDELASLRSQAEAADLGAVEEAGAACCYANSNKHWITDPSGIAWESFHSLGEIPIFGEAQDQAKPTPAASVCCPPAAEKAEASAGCCG